MSLTYSPRRRRESKRNEAEPSGGSGKESSLPNSAQLTELGHQVDMPVVMREKMEGKDAHLKLFFAIIWRQ